MNPDRESLTVGSSDLALAMTELTYRMQRRVILVVSIAYLLWYIVATASWPDAFGWNAVLFLVLLEGANGVSLYLLQRSLRAGQVAWHLMLLVTITLAIGLFNRGEVAVGYVFVPFFAAMTVHWMAGLIVEGGIGLLLAVLPTVGYPSLNESTATGVLMAGAAMGLLGFVASRSLITTMEWYAHSYKQAEENLLSVRLHRAQLMRVQKSLDEAYYRLKRVNAALVAAWKAADEAERFKAEFVANVSHELRTPLNLIVGFSEVMMTSPESYGDAHLPREYRTDLNAIYHSAQHLLALVDDVLDLARIEVGKIALARDEVDAAALFAEALEIVRDYIATKGLDLQVHIAPDIPKLWIDRLRIRQVLLNLLVNAARFTDIGFIRVEAHAQDQEICIRVTDSGRGIPPSDLPKIFDEFRSTEQPLSMWHSGTGLGLPISKKFVELNGGAMGVNSIYGQGTEFWFSLPCVAELRPGETAQSSPHPSYRAQPGPADRLSPQDRIVVLVHDDARVAPLLERYLDGYRVVYAQHLQEGIDLCDKAKALAIVTDEALPAEMPLPPGLLHIRCKLPSGHAVALTLGANDMLVKPVTRQDLEMAVARLGRPVHRILITDDDPELVRLFRRMLDVKESAREFLEAYTGAEALQVMRTAQPDLVLLDLVMPDGDGHTVLNQMANDPNLASIATIVVSAKGMDYLASPMLHTISISRTDGFQLGEIISTLNATFKALTPGWQPAAPSAPTFAKAALG